MALSNERKRLAEFLAEKSSTAVADYISKTPKIQKALLDLSRQQLDIDALLAALRDGDRKTSEDARDVIDRFLEIRSGKLPLENLPLSVRVKSSIDSVKEEGSLAADSLKKAGSHFLKSQFLRSGVYAGKFLTEVSAAALSATGLTKRERQLGMALGVEMALATLFTGHAQAALNPQDIDSALNAVDKNNLAERMNVMPRTPLELAIRPNSDLQADFEGAQSLKESPYLLSPYLVKKLNEDPEARKIMQIIIKEAKKADFDVVIAANQIFRESFHFSKDYIYGPKTSPAGAMGVAQIMPGTGKENGLMVEADFFNPEKAIPVYFKIMNDHRKRYNGDYILSLAAYNGGGEAVNFAKKELGKSKITGSEWLSFMTERFERLGKTSGSAWHFETRQYVGDITNLHWENTYKSWAKKIQGGDPLAYIGTLSGKQAQNIGQQKIQNIIN